MIWPFSSRTRSAEAPQKLYFNGGESFLKYQCKYGYTDICPKQGIVALVLDASAEFGTAEAVKVKDDGRQLAVLRVASSDGGFNIIAETPNSTGDRLKPGDVVIWVPVSYTKEIVLEDMDKRFGWMGFIAAKVKPEIDMANPNFEVMCKYA